MAAAQAAGLAPVVAGGARWCCKRAAWAAFLRFWGLKRLDLVNFYRSIGKIIALFWHDGKWLYFPLVDKSGLHRFSAPFSA
ncbi:hypothetical protein EII18_05245 [Comamonadaceae bacterium OH3737_COT-264]|nr:hypothetical protein EII18_05245 [Comamonadaceae bacterium OH3737_COT-264]